MAPSLSRTPRAAVAAAAAALTALTAAACSKDDKPGAGPAPAADELVSRWRKAGLEVSALTEVAPDPYSAQSCKGGTVSGVDVVVCKYDTGEDAKAAEDPGLEVVGGVTGAALARGSRLLVVADRRKVDPAGKTIHAITQAFRR